MKLISSEELLRTQVFWVTRDVAIDPEGFEITRAIVQHGGSAAVMPVDDQNRVLLVRQYRLPTKTYLWEIAAGRVDPGETVLQAARRELREETGLRARKISKLAEMWVSPGFLAEKTSVYLASGLTPGEQTPMEDERIETRWFTVAELDKLISAGKLTDAKTVLAFLKWQRYLASPAKPTRRK
jgi:ADP-ribose pyrophosphatase